VGTVAADDAAAVVDGPSLYELTHVDRDRYTIVAVDLIVDGPTTATVYAFDRIERGISLKRRRSRSWMQPRVIRMPKSFTRSRERTGGLFPAPWSGLTRRSSLRFSHGDHYAEERGGEREEEHAGCCSGGGRARA
jgi:hypothetical protein